MTTSHESTARAATGPTIAAALVAAWKARTLVAAPSRTLPDLRKDEALTIAEGVRALRIAAGSVPVGYKVGFTNAAVRAQFGAEAPLAATVYDDTLQTQLRIAAGPLLGPRIEPEIVIGIGADGEAAWAALGFEIVQSHVADWNFGYLDAIADFGLHAALIVGERSPLEPGAPGLQNLEVVLERNGQVSERGSGADVDGGALGSVAWLRGDLQRVGRALAPGEIVSTGSMTRVPAIASGERWTLRALGGELPQLTIDVD